MSVVGTWCVSIRKGRRLRGLSEQGDGVDVWAQEGRGKKRMEKTAH